MYAVDNGDLLNDLCSSFNQTSFGNDTEFCSDLQRVVATEAASGVSWRSKSYVVMYVHTY